MGELLRGILISIDGHTLSNRRYWLEYSLLWVSVKRHEETMGPENVELPWTWNS